MTPGHDPMTSGIEDLIKNTSDQKPAEKARLGPGIPFRLPFIILSIAGGIFVNMMDFLLGFAIFLACLAFLIALYRGIEQIINAIETQKK